MPVNVISPLNWTFPPFVAAALSPVKSETGVAVPLEVPPVASNSVIASSPRVIPPPPYYCQSGCRHYADCHTDCQCHTNQSFFHLQKPPYKNMFRRSAPAGKPDASVAFFVHGGQIISTIVTNFGAFGNVLRQIVEYPVKWPFSLHFVPRKAVISP